MRKSKASKDDENLIVALVKWVPAFLFRLSFCLFKFGHRRRWAVYRFRRMLRNRGVPADIAKKLALEYETFLTMRELKKFLI